MGDAIRGMGPELTRAEEYTFDTPEHIKTGEDAVKLFSCSAAKQGLIIYCNLNPEQEKYDPYDLVVAGKANLDTANYYVFTQSGITHMWYGNLVMPEG